MLMQIKSGTSFKNVPLAADCQPETGLKRAPGLNFAANMHWNHPMCESLTHFH
jgi:hypothetical protein